MEFDNLFELLETVRTYVLRPKERLIPITNVTGSILGYATADSAYPSIEWVIPSRVAKKSARDRGTREAKRIQELFVSHMGRRQLLEELRAGVLEYGIAIEMAPIEGPEEGPRQLELPL